MTIPEFDRSVLDTFLELGGEDLRIALLAQVRADLLRCHDVLAANAPDVTTLPNLCRAAHEVKGIAATVGALRLAELARVAESACAQRDPGEAALALPGLRDETRRTAEALDDLARA